jgi:hypothetical protein
MLIVLLLGFGSLQITMPASREGSVGVSTS